MCFQLCGTLRETSDVGLMCECVFSCVILYVYNNETSDVGLMCKCRFLSLRYFTCTIMKRVMFVWCVNVCFQHRDTYIYACGNETDDVVRFVQHLPTFQVNCERPELRMFTVTFNFPFCSLSAVSYSCCCCCCTLFAVLLFLCFFASCFLFLFSFLLNWNFTSLKTGPEVMS